MSVFGIAGGQSLDELRQLIDALLDQGLLSSSGGQYPTLQVTPEGRAFLKARQPLALTRPVAQNLGSAYLGPETSGRRGSNRRGRNRSLDDSDASPYDERLFQELAALRKRIADQQGVPAFVIFGDKSLREMARKAPSNRQDFAQISGVGEAKLRELSGPFIRVIRDYVKANGQAQFDEPEQEPAEEKRPRIVGQTYLETGRIISAGATIAEAAEQRGLAETTVLGHLERLIQEGEEVWVEHLMPGPERRAEIEAVFEAVGDNPLRPVWEELRGEYTYAEIRLVRLTRRQSTRWSPTA